MKGDGSVSGSTLRVDHGDSAMVEIGKYSAADKLRKLCAVWAGDEPADRTETDRHRRPLLNKWEAYAKAGGRGAVYDHIREKRLGIETAVAEKVVESFFSGGLAESHDGALFRDIDIAGLRTAFKAGALKRLSYTEDDGEIPTLDLLRGSSLFYPAYILEGASSALCVFVTFFLGRNDVLYVHDAGIEKVTLVDIDEWGLEAMKKIYPTHWSFVRSDYLKYLDDAIERGEHYHVVTCDQPLFMAEDVGWTHIRKFLSLTDKFFICNYTGDMLSQIDFQTGDIASMSARLSDKMGMPLKINGVFPRIKGHHHHWVILEK